MFFVPCVSHDFASVHFCLVVTCWERADLLALVGDVYRIFVTFPCGTLGQVWYLVVSFPDICRLSFFRFCNRFPCVNAFLTLLLRKLRDRCFFVVVRTLSSTL